MKSVSAAARAVNTGRPHAYTLRGKRVWVAGHTGLVGSALLRRLQGAGCELLTVNRAALDLRLQRDVHAWMKDARPQAIFIAAATVGGILANSTRPAEFLYDNLAIATNIIQGAVQFGVEKLMFLGSSCMYPRLAEQPIGEETLLTGPLEPTNEAYAIAKIAGAKLCEAYRRQSGMDFITAVPTALYGPGDDFDPVSSHVVSALIRKFHVAKTSGQNSVEIWGTGSPLREFMFVDDASDALAFLMERYSSAEPINVGCGDVVSIRELAGIIAGVIGYRGELRFDTTKPDGMPRKQLRADRLAAMGWQPRVPLREGLTRTYQWFLASAWTDSSMSSRDAPGMEVPPKPQAH